MDGCRSEAFMLCRRRTIDPSGPFVRLLQARFVTRSAGNAREVQPTPAGALDVSLAVRRRLLLISALAPANLARASGRSS